MPPTEGEVWVENRNICDEEPSTIQQSRYNIFKDAQNIDLATSLVNQTQYMIMM